jgi:two-component system CheB/CheR fusion protein
LKKSKSKSATTPRARKTVPAKQRFPIIGIGASAGGLEALEQFLSNVPLKSGMAYVVVQHLDPTQKGMLPELLQRICKMKVFQVNDNMVVKPDCVYVIPPNKSMSILKGVLYLFDPKETRGMRLPIDLFLRSLADDQQEMAIGVILSGMGSDGSSGLRAITEKHGIVMIQDPATAKFDSMPSNAIDSVQADIIAPADELAEKLVDFLKISPALNAKEVIEIKNKSALDKIIILLRSHTGNDFSSYKKSTVYRRIERRIAIHKLENIAGYIPFLQENPKEIDILFKELLIGVTNFFRDGEVWERMKEIIISEINSRYQLSESIVRVWVAGCSTGEEAYTLAILFYEALDQIKTGRGPTIQIFATDLDAEAIEIARKGVFPVNITSDVSTERLDKHFIPVEGGYRVKNEIREMVVFAEHNIIMHPPFTKIDFLSCRNMLIYMDSDLQKKLLHLFYYSMNQDGILLLGSSETLGTQSYLFAPEYPKVKIFRHTVSSQIPELLDFPSSFSRNRINHVEKKMHDKAIPNLQTLADHALMQHYKPVGVLVNEAGDIMYISGSTGKYLEPAVGKANLNIFAMLCDGLGSEFPPAFRSTIANRKSVVLHNLKVDANGSTYTVDMHLQWIDQPKALQGMVMVIFSDVQVPAEVKKVAISGKRKVNTGKISESEKELLKLREEMQNTLEEMQTSQEELKSTNEELQSTNEELQSTNEELTSSKEEMQSLNEELQTVNAELQATVDEFSRVENDMKNLLNSTDIATLFLDKELHIRRYTEQASKIFKLIKSDIGRPITDLSTDLVYPDLIQDAIEVLRTLVFIQKPIPASEGRWFKVRIMPYRTTDDRIDGLVITFINSSDLKKAELKLTETDRINKILADTCTVPVIRLTNDWKILEFNPKAESYFNIKRQDAIDRNYFQLLVSETERAGTERKMNKLLKTSQTGCVKMQVKNIGEKKTALKWLMYNANTDPGITPGLIMIAERDQKEEDNWR